jgi:glutamine phosphoribosylpyrophosphate amidotransferase
MCGIVGAVSTRNIVPVLVQGLQRLEYRGYDSCGVAVYVQGGQAQHSGLRRARSTARVAELMEQVAAGDSHTPLEGMRTRTSAMARGRTRNSVQVVLHWCTTASLKTTTNCAPRSKPRAMCLSARPTPRSLPTW